MVSALGDRWWIQGVPFIGARVLLGGVLVKGMCMRGVWGVYGVSMG